MPVFRFESAHHAAIFSNYYSEPSDWVFTPLFSYVKGGGNKKEEEPFLCFLPSFLAGAMLSLDYMNIRLQHSV